MTVCWVLVYLNCNAPSIHDRLNRLDDHPGVLRGGRHHGVAQTLDLTS